MFERDTYLVCPSNALTGGFRVNFDLCLIVAYAAYVFYATRDTSNQFSGPYLEYMMF